MPNQNNGAESLTLLLFITFIIPILSVSHIYTISQELIYKENRKVLFEQVALQFLFSSLHQIQLLLISTHYVRSWNKDYVTQSLHVSNACLLKTLSHSV